MTDGVSKPQIYFVAKKDNLAVLSKQEWHTFLVLLNRIINGILSFEDNEAYRNQNLPTIAEKELLTELESRGIENIGDVSGPNAAVRDSSFVAWDGTSGKLVKETRWFYSTDGVTWNLFSDVNANISSTTLTVGATSGILILSGNAAMDLFVGGSSALTIQGVIQLKLPVFLSDYVEWNWISAPSAPSSGKVLTYAKTSVENQIFAKGVDGIERTVVNTLNNSTNSAPGVNNDNTQGYGIGSEWLDTTGPTWYKASSVATGAAVWTMI